MHQVANRNSKSTRSSSAGKGAMPAPAKAGPTPQQLAAQEPAQLQLDELADLNADFGNQTVNTLMRPGAEPSPRAGAPSPIIQPQRVVRPAADASNEQRRAIAPNEARRMPGSGLTIQGKFAEPVKPLQRRAKVNINDDPELEKEADVMGQKALSYAHPQTNSLSGGENQADRSGLVQRQDSITTSEPSRIIPKSNDTGLPDRLKAGIEGLSGYSLDDVKVHYNSPKPAQLQAHAYAQGTDIHVAPGQQKHLAHEAWHVVQQKQGRVKPTMQMKGKVNVHGVHQMAESAFARNWRIFKRFLSRKTLPSNTYRWDTREPAVIAGVGFKPWDKNGNVTLKEHVNNSSDDDGSAVKHESQWVSTGAFGMLKKIDPTFAQQVLNTKLYKIDTSIAQQNSSNNFVDVNAHFDSIEVERPYASQKEWAMEKDGIAPQAIVAWMTGSEFIEQYDYEAGELSVNEESLSNWKQMPTGKT